MKTLNDKWLIEAFTEEYPELAHNLMSDTEETICRLLHRFIDIKKIDNLIDKKDIWKAENTIKTSIRRVIATELLSNDLKWEKLNLF